MQQTFTEYSEISIRALEFNPKYKEVITKKQEIFNSIEQHYRQSPISILFYGFSPLLLAVTNKNIFATAITDTAKKLIEANNVKYSYIAEDQLPGYKKKFDWVVASDECFTFAKNEEQQRIMINSFIGLAKNLVVTTLRDYKNQDYKDKEFSQPLAVYNGQESKLFLEYHNYDLTDKNSWNTMVYELQGSNSTVYGPFARRSMFFKQMAKFSIDAGAKNFYVHKNLMYKSLIKKNYEHVISIAL